VDNKNLKLQLALFLIHTFRMDISASFYQAAKVPPRRYGHKFTNPKFSPRLKSNRRFKMRKPKWMK